MSPISFGPQAAHNAVDAVLARRGCTPPAGMSIADKLILADVLEAMQEADEIGGPDTVDAYVLLMQAIITAAKNRITVARASAGETP